MYHDFAKELRHRSTDAEKILWKYLFAHRTSGLKFRRQQPIGKYIVDFVCFEKRVIIELDGGQHAEHQMQDAERDTWLRAQGYTVLRIWNSDVFHNLEGVLQTILDACSGGEH